MADHHSRYGILNKYVGGPRGGGGKPLDGLVSSAAFSVRKLYSAYKGDCVLLRRSSDDAELAFGFTGAGNLDTAAISAWGGGDTLYVKTWYDQSGYGYNASQATAGAQPTLVLNALNGHPTLGFDGNRYLLTANATSPAQAQPYTLVVVGRVLDVVNYMLFDGGYVTALRALLDKPATLNATWGEWRFGTNPWIVSDAGMGDIKYNVLTAQANGASSFVRAGGYQIATGNAGTNAFAGISLGARGFNPSVKLSGNLATAIVLPLAHGLSVVGKVEQSLGQYFGLDVTGSVYNIVCEGDSRTLFAGELTYPKQLAHSALSTIPRARLTETNHGTSGHTLAAMWTDRANVAALYDAAKARNILVLWGGTNDFSLGADEPTVLSRFLALADYHLAAGFEVIGCTELPRDDVGKPAGFDANRAALNTHIRANAAAHGYTVADLAADTRIGDDGDEADTTYYNADKIHLIAAGYGVVAGIVAAAIG